MVASDVIEDILLRSDVKDLVPWKRVCKSWYSLISSPSFVKSHLKKNNDSSNTNNKEVGHTRIAMPPYWKTGGNKYQYNHWRVVGSSNGLVCISPFFEDPLLILVCNPWTREIRKLPTAPNVTEDIKGGLCMNFGYDSSTDDYKVLLAIRKSFEPIGALFLIFSMKSNTWKPIGRFNYVFYRPLPGIFLNGAFHWFGYDYNVCKHTRQILSFDLSREEFNVIPQPSDPRYVLGFTILGIAENQLCIFYTNEDNDFPRDMWVMRSYNVEESWELLPPNVYEMKHEVVHNMKMLHYTSPNKNKNMMGFFCDDNKMLLRDWKYIRADIFVPSLLSPYVNIGKPSHPKNNKTSVEAWGDMTIFQPWSIKRMKSIEESYRHEVGETENLYLYEDDSCAGK